MKIAVISTPVFQVKPPSGTIGYSGLEVLAWHQAVGLAKLGHQVALVAPDGSEAPGCEVIHIGPAGQISEEHAYSGFPEIKMGWQTARAAHAGYWQQLPRFDCIIDSSWQKNSYALKAEGVLKAPILGVCHAPVDTMFKKLPDGVPKPCFACISEDQGNHFRTLYHADCRVAYNGIDTEHYKPLNTVRRNRFLFLARFSTIKGPDIAIEACRTAGAELDLVGDTQITNEPQYLEDCKAMCDGQRIRMVGPATRGECIWWFSQANCLLHPNLRFLEPFGLSPVESQACGAPVIAWNYGAMRETVKHGETGWLVTSIDDVVERIKEVSAIFGTPAMDQIRVRCREWASQFSIDRMVRRYAELCHEAVDTGGW